jgi:hypothetical protein
MDIGSLKELLDYAAVVKRLITLERMQMQEAKII